MAGRSEEEARSADVTTWTLLPGRIGAKAAAMGPVGPGMAGNVTMYSPAGAPSPLDKTVKTMLIDVPTVVRAALELNWHGKLEAPGTEHAMATVELAKLM